MELPIQLLEELESVPGFSASDFTEAHRQVPPTSIRMHPLKAPVHYGENLDAVPWCNAGRYLPERPLFTVDPLLHGGAYYVQEASSMFLDYILRSVYPEPEGLRVLDLCAAPGGKSTLLASFLDERSLLISNEVIRNRAGILGENMTRWGYKNAWVCSNDPKDLGKMQGYFDLIVVDAPCSGSGLFRKDERAIAEWSPENVQLCAARQQRILHDVLPALKEGGCLIYATCSYSPEEDEQIMDFLAAQFPLESVPVTVQDDWGIVRVTSAIHGINGYRFFPHRLRGEGFFITVLRKASGETAMPLPKFKSVHARQMAVQIDRFLEQDSYLLLPAENNQFMAIPAGMEADYHYLKQFVYLRKTGITVGGPGPKEWIPEHDLALSVDLRKQLQTVELDLEQALLYLKKETFATPAGAVKGWNLVTYKGLGLGWIKVLDNRINNYLPKNWRIRMDIDWETIL
ncbi:methyltransferase RsmF C-terminal domain-like protein [Rurimicrobium arvi]|uniref:rRNA cytosine-C5-methyltransferase n=1 Tax=Rurimicrobium arvi TaxID=2049916 RepID=A0ABP8MF60_9BACT